MASSLPAPQLCAFLWGRKWCFLSKFLPLACGETPYNIHEFHSSSISLKVTAGARPKTVIYQFGILQSTMLGTIACALRYVDKRTFFPLPPPLSPTELQKQSS